MERKWWHDKIAYQIYPKSFCDSNGDGIGDLNGIRSKLDYLQKLGVDIIWLSPVYKSPFVDQGYDISDYYAIAEEFGTMEEFDLLLSEMKQRGMSLIMDLVVNHCSDKHEWFQKALADPAGEYGEYFYFRKGKDGNPPNNTRSYFGGSIWEPVPGTDLYYLHMFAKEQPDLNWENPVVRQKIYDMVNWWLEKGLAGFRIDAITNIKKDTTFPSSDPDGPDGLSAAYRIIPASHGVGEFLQELKHSSFAIHDALTVGEVFQPDPACLAEFVGPEGHFSTMFDFTVEELSYGAHGWYDAPEIPFKTWRDALYSSQRKMLGLGFLANIIENHDEPRGASRMLPEHAQNEAGKKMLGTIYMLMRGIPFIYQGQELGMTNCRRSDISEYDDISTKTQYRLALEAGLTKEEALEMCYRESRDNARTPMQWTGGPNGGFTTGIPWLGMNPNYTEINAAEQENRPDSVLNYYRRLTALRKSADYIDTFTYGDFRPAFEQMDGIYAYYRVNEETGQTILVAGNFGNEKYLLPLTGNATLLLSNLDRNPLTGPTLLLDKCECAVLLCE